MKKDEVSGLNKHMGEGMPCLRQAWLDRMIAYGKGNLHATSIDCQAPFAPHALLDLPGGLPAVPFIVFHSRTASTSRALFGPDFRADGPVPPSLEVPNRIVMPLSTFRPLLSLEM